MANRFVWVNSMEYRNSEISRVIDDVIHSARDRRVLKLRFIDGLTYEKIAAEMDMSVRQIQNIIYRHEMIVFRGLGL